MKTPREILLARHRAVEPELNRIRRDAIQVAQATSLFRRATSPTEWGRRFERVRMALGGEGAPPFRSAGCRPGRASCPRYPFFRHVFTFAATASRALATLYRELIWPCRRTWAGLAAVWLVLLSVNFATREPAPASEARRATPESSQLEAMFRLREQMLAQLAGPIEKLELVRPKLVVPQPRSQRRDEFMTA